MCYYYYIFYILYILLLKKIKAKYPVLNDYGIDSGQYDQVILVKRRTFCEEHFASLRTFEEHFASFYGLKRC